MNTHPPTSKRIRPVAFWVTTFPVVFELAAGSVWNLLTIDWIEIQLNHLGYPHFFAYLLGAWQVAAAVAIIVPGFPLLKEWAYAGTFFLWSGAVLSHLIAGDGVLNWGPPLMFTVLAVASWALRPAGRRLPATRPPAPGVRAWAVPVGLLVVLYAVSFLTLPLVEETMREHAVQLGWTD
ncbi:DoxX family protein [Amycolatopsis suaedae]|uniref:DoxX family protein n=1 Tax=Amycolatopsis suaedae TaxID=2510978 RepID=A0A4Q7J8A2_9PSEU|nr:DoxX family protein [Amycolatopsis suaedae]RZQ62314.1 DoxX family protein [Amycolatopsis suaedae]